MSVMLFGHAGFDVTELLGDHAHGNAMHGQSRAVGVPEHAESNSRLDVCPLTGPQHWPKLVRLARGAAVMSREDQLVSSSLPRGRGYGMRDRWR